MAKRVIFSVLIYSVILFTAIIAAIFSAVVAGAAGVAGEFWNWPVGTLERIIPTFSQPARDVVFMLYMMVSIVLLPLLFIYGSSFTITFLSLTFFRRCRIHLKSSDATKWAMAGIRLLVSSGYSTLSFLVILGGVISWRLYENTAPRIPAPYPDTVISVRTLANLGGFEGFPENYSTSTVYNYTCKLPAGVIESYYTREMGKYCVEGWEFFDADCHGYASCRRARCDISHPLVKVFSDLRQFTVTLYPVSDTDTLVGYTVTKRDLLKGWFPGLFAPAD